jgi:hypothetical protein
MQDIQKHLESLLLNAAECQRVSDAATDQAKRDLFARLAEHHLVLASEIERAITERQTDPGSMDASMLSRHLATTERHILEGERQIAAQQQKSSSCSAPVQHRASSSRSPSLEGNASGP